MNRQIAGEAHRRLGLFEGAWLRSFLTVLRHVVGLPVEGLRAGPGAVLEDEAVLEVGGLRTRSSVV
jgi:hypothetical protein